MDEKRLAEIEAEYKTNAPGLTIKGVVLRNLIAAVRERDAEIVVLKARVAELGYADLYEQTPGRAPEGGDNDG